MSVFPGFCGPCFTGPSKSTNPEDCDNFYQEVQPPGAKSQLPLIGVPGTESWKTYAPGPIRGMKANENFAIIVSGDKYYAVSADDVTINSGDISNDTLPVRIVSGGNLGFNAVLSAGIVYYTNGVDTPAVIPVADPPWDQALDIEFISGFYVVLDGLNDAPTGGRLWVSAPDDPRTWDPLDFEYPLPGGDNKWIAIRESHNQLVMFGNRSTVPFIPTDTDFPLTVARSGIVSQGAFTRNLIWKMRQSAEIGDDTLYCVARDKDGHLTIIRYDGYQPVKVSTNTIDRILDNYANPSDGIAWSFEMNGHCFGHLNFTADKMGWRYDAMTGLWNRATRRDPISGERQAHVGNFHIFRNERHFIGSRLTGKVYELSDEFYDDDGDALVSERVTAILSRENKLLPHGYLEIDADTGQGIAGSPEEEPLLEMWFSDDSGETWVYMGTESFGIQGDYDKRIRYEQLGSARNRVYKFRTSARIRRVINGAYIGM